MNLQQAIGGYLVHSQVKNKTEKTITNIKWNLVRFLKWKGDSELERITTAEI